MNTLLYISFNMLIIKVFEIYVGNLAWRVTENDLFGEIAFKLRMHRTVLPRWNAALPLYLSPDLPSLASSRCLVARRDPTSFPESLITLGSFSDDGFFTERSDDHLHRREPPHARSKPSLFHLTCSFFLSFFFLKKNKNSFAFLVNPI